MTTVTRQHPKTRESRLSTQRSLPTLDTARVPHGLEAIEPFGELIEERKRLFNEAIHARSTAERADLEVFTARDLDAAAFEQAALQSGKDPGRKNEAAALKAQDEAHRVAVGLTRAANTATRKIRAAIDGSDGDEAMAKVNAQIDADLEQVRASAEAARADLGTALARVALLESIASTRKAEHRTLRDSPPRQPEFLIALERLSTFDPREVLFGER